MLDIRAIVELKKPTLIGPTTSINGVFLGPFYYYFNLIPYFLSGGDPSALTYWNILWYGLGAIGLIWFFYKENKLLALISSSIFLMAPAMFYSSRFFWSANPMPYMTIFYFVSVLSYLKKPGVLNSSLVGLISGASMQVEAAFGVTFFPFFFIFSLFNRPKLKFLAISVGTFLLTLLPQIIFELRHQFIMTKTFFSEVSGKSQILGERLDFSQTFLNHLNTYTNFTKEIFQLPEYISSVLIGISIIYLTYLFFKKKLSQNNRYLFLVSISFIVFTFSFYLLYSYPLKGWYLLGLRIPYIFLIALFLFQIFSKHLVLKVLVCGIIALSFFNTYQDQSRFLQDINYQSTDKSTLRNEMTTVDWVYSKANGDGFTAYNYIPSVYDFPYQYLYWWYGNKKYGYQPEKVTYLDNVPEYIQNNEVFFKSKKPATNGNVFLIYEPDENNERLAAWLGNFTKFCSIEKQTFDWGTTVELRRLCK